MAQSVEVGLAAGCPKDKANLEATKVERFWISPQNEQRNVSPVPEEQAHNPSAAPNANRTIVFSR
jgi:hypothetical protein